jgi:NAD(P)-dependent dehydrogenase (short-subunit alcohol dehydrogenase family)
METGGGVRVVVITGCDSGIGAALASACIERGFTVVAGYLGPLPAPLSARHRPVPLDLGNEGSIASFAREALNVAHGGQALHALVSNAGTVVAGPVENVPIDAVREAFEVNFFGTYSLVQKFVPALIGAKGRLLLVGSLAGLVAMPFFSPYVSSKFALEGFADSVRRELAPFGVRTTIFEPAAVATPIWDESWRKIEERWLPLVSDRYRAVFLDLARRFVSGGNEGMGADRAALAIMRALVSRRPKPRYILAKNPAVSALEAAIPDRLLDSLIFRAFSLGRLAGSPTSGGKRQ